MPLCLARNGIFFIVPKLPLTNPKWAGPSSPQRKKIIGQKEEGNFYGIVWHLEKPQYIPSPCGKDVECCIKPSPKSSTMNVSCWTWVPSWVGTNSALLTNGHLVYCIATFGISLNPLGRGLWLFPGGHVAAETWNYVLEQGRNAPEWVTSVVLETTVTVYKGKCLPCRAFPASKP